MTTASRRRMPRADRRDQLVAAAEELFAQQGFAAASMDGLAQAAGVTKPVLYDHFGSKDGLLAAVLEQAGARLLARTTAAVEEHDSPEEALRRGLLAYFRFVDQHAAAWTLLLHEVTPGSQAAQAADRIRAEQVAAIAGLVALHLPGCPPSQASVYAEVVSGAAERLAAVRLSGRRLSAERATGLLMDLLWTGFAALHQSTREGRT